MCAIQRFPHHGVESLCRFTWHFLLKTQLTALKATRIRRMRLLGTNEQGVEKLNIIADTIRISQGL